MLLRKSFAWCWLKILGWKAVGGGPGVDKYVLIAAPHTTNWDMPFMLLVSWRLGFKLHWMGKKSLFRFPYGWWMRLLGGISIDRSKRQNTVDQVVEWMSTKAKVIVVVPPEGTRGTAEFWKSGFYHIARKAEVPIVLGFLDYKNRCGGFGAHHFPTTDPVADMAVFREFYHASMARYPEKFTVPRLREEVTVGDGEETPPNT